MIEEQDNGLAGFDGPYAMDGSLMIWLSGIKCLSYTLKCLIHFLNLGNKLAMAATF